MWICVDSYVENAHTAQHFMQCIILNLDPGETTFDQKSHNRINLRYTKLFVLWKVSLMKKHLKTCWIHSYNTGKRLNRDLLNISKTTTIIDVVRNSL